MHLFSLLLIVFTLGNLIVGRDVLQVLRIQTTITIFVCLFINVGYFLDSQVISVDYYQAALIIQLVVSVIALLMKKPLTRVVVNRFFICYFICLTISLILLIVLPASNASVTGAGGYFELFMVGKKRYLSPEFTKFALFFYVLAIILAIDFIILDSLFKKDDWVRLVHLTAISSKIIIIIVFIEFIIKNILKSDIYFSMVTFIFGQGPSTYSQLVERGSFQMLQGLSRECSHLAYSLTMALILLFADRETNPHSKFGYFWIGLAGLELLFAGSFTSVWSVFILYLMYIAYSGYSIRAKSSGYALSKKLFIVITLSFFLLVVAAIVISFSGKYTFSRISELFSILKKLRVYSTKYFSKNYAITSSQTRLYSIISTFKEFITNRPLFGLGPGTTYCYSDLMLTLSEIGLLGIVFFSRSFFDPRRDKCEKKAYLICALLWMLYNLLTIYHGRLTVAVDIIIFVAILKVLFVKESVELLNSESMILPELKK